MIESKEVYSPTLEYLEEIKNIFGKYSGKTMLDEVIVQINTDLQNSKKLNNWIENWCFDCSSCGRLPTFSIEENSNSDYRRDCLSVDLFLGCGCERVKITNWGLCSKEFFKQWNDRVFCSWNTDFKKKIGG